MTADHPTREERYAAVIEALARRLADAFPDSGDDCFDQSAYAGDPDMWESKAEDRAWYLRFAERLLAADHAPAQPDAALSDDEREVLNVAVDEAETCKCCGDAYGAVHIYAAVERIIASRMSPGAAGDSNG